MTRLAMVRATCAFLVFFNSSCSRQKKGNSVVASKWSEAFHVPTCEWAGKIESSNRRSFKNAKEASDAGLAPCKVCRRQNTARPISEIGSSYSPKNPTTGNDSGRQIQSFEKLN